LRGQIVRAAKSNRERNCTAPVNELEADLCDESFGIVRGIKSLFADWLFKFMENEFAVLDGFRLRGLRGGLTPRRKRRKESKCKSNRKSNSPTDHSSP
jgi:hypothetical protein